MMGKDINVFFIILSMVILISGITEVLYLFSGNLIIFIIGYLATFYHLVLR